ncbi:MAG TPA: DUF1223 domain-containing protein [Chthoniobacterales bacterium]|nr:DUF1223 domain-containing protein [Chthoniobacterales bacterium]
MSPKPRHIHKQKLSAIHRFTFVLWFSAALTAAAGDLKFESGPQRVHLLELFTSEGCSSCPPAEAWLSKMKAEPRLWKDFVPIAFHVDYWDRLGWRDPFASKEWTARQYQYSVNWKIETVYTPGFVLDGRELLERTVPSLSSERPGVLRLSLADGKIAAESNSGNSAKRDVALHLATLGFDLTTKITAGENNGRNLHQDFVVLSLASEKMSNGKAEFSFTLDARAGAIAAWITEPNQLEPIQAVGGWLR